MDCIQALSLFSKVRKSFYVPAYHINLSACVNKPKPLKKYFFRMVGKCVLS